MPGFAMSSPLPVFPATHTSKIRNYLFVCYDAFLCSNVEMNFYTQFVTKTNTRHWLHLNLFGPETCLGSLCQAPYQFSGDPHVQNQVLLIVYVNDAYLCSNVEMNVYTQFVTKMNTRHLLHLNLFGPETSWVRYVRPLTRFPGLKPGIINLVC